MASRVTGFDPTSLAALPEPVRRYLGKAILPGAPLSPAWVLQMKGRIKVGIWLPFAARQELDGSSFVWRARVPSGKVALLEVTDSFADGEGGMAGRIAGRQVFADTGEDACRSAATRAVMESTMVPATLLPSTGVEWTSVSENEIRFRRPELPLAEEVTIRISPDGSPSEVEAPRWLKEKDEPGALVPFRCRLEGFIEREGQVVPDGLTAGWVKGSFEPFFEARITAVEGLSVP